MTTPIGLAALACAAIPALIGYDIATTLTQRSGASDRSIRTPLGAIHAATFSFLRPSGNGSESIGAAIGSMQALFDLSKAPPSEDSGAVNRSRKADRLIPRAFADWARREELARAAASASAPSAPSPQPSTAESAAPELAVAALGSLADRPSLGAGHGPAVAPRKELAETGRAPESAAPSPWDDMAHPTLAEEAFSPAMMAWLGAADEPAAQSAPAPERAVADLAPPVVTAAREPAAEAPPAERPVVVASASPDFPLPREAVPKAELAIPAQVEQAAAAAGRASDDSDPAHTGATSPTTLSRAASPAIRAMRVYFGAEPLAGPGGGLEPWAASEAMVGAEADHEMAYEDEERIAARVRLASLGSQGSETIVNKGVLQGASRAMLSPAERLGLEGEERQQAERCLTDAIYFESRGEPVRGQVAVAQVVMNRVFSGYYPSTVCGVVYQNAHRKLACQFTFACDGIKDKITEPQAWERAKTIARETLDGKHWLADVGKSTHYHAYWVRPRWVRTMEKLDKIGVHTFYRPRLWGDGADKPAWGDGEIPIEPATPVEFPPS